VTLLRVALVILAMAIAFGIGAYIASRTELFPPQVEGGVPGPTDGLQEDGPGVGSFQRWRGTIRSETSQGYREGSCTSNWESDMDLIVESDGTVRGAGRTGLLGEARCPFAGGQDQIGGYVFAIGGAMDGGGFTLRLGGFERTDGNLDYGGFQITIASAEPELEVPLESPNLARSRVTFETKIEDHVARSRNVIRLACAGCAQQSEPG
jgi:hypothetical protein